MYDPLQRLKSAKTNASPSKVKSAAVKVDPKVKCCG